MADEDNDQMRRKVEENTRKIADIDRQIRLLDRLADQNAKILSQLDELERLLRNMS